jgi:integrase
MFYRISKKPCKETASGIFYYKQTAIDEGTHLRMEKPRRISLSTRNRTIALARLKIIQQKLQNEPIQKKTITFSEYLLEFIHSEKLRIKNQEFSEASHNEDIRYLEKFRSFMNKRLYCKDFFLSQITPTHAKHFIESFIGRTHNETGARARKAARRIGIRFFENAWLEQLISENPFRRTLPVRYEKKEADPFEIADLRALLLKMPENTYLQKTQKNAIRFAYNTGIRRSNIRSIKIIDYKIDENQLSYIYMPKTKNGKEHCVAVAGEALNAYLDQLDNLKIHFGKVLSPDMSLFANQNGKMFHKDTISKWVSKSIKRHSPNLEGKTFHKLRTTTANMVEEVGGHGSATEVLGHDREDTTDRFYLKKKKKTNLSRQHEWLSQTPLLTAPRQKDFIHLI